MHAAGPPASTKDVRLRTAVDVLATRLGIPQSDAQEFLRFYNEEMTEYGNEVYSQVESRIAHWTNYLAGGWFQDRLRPYLERTCSVDLVVDLGFSVPYVYADPDRLATADTVFLFVDKEDSVLPFYDAVVDLLNLHRRRESDRVLVANIEQADGRRQIVDAVRSLSPSSTLIVASEVIEHLDDPRTGWDLLGQLEVAGHGVSYVTLPVGKRIPSHNLQFLDDGAATDYIRANMMIEKEEDMSVLRPPEGCQVFPFLRACACARGYVSQSTRDRDRSSR